MALLCDAKDMYFSVLRSAEELKSAKRMFLMSSGNDYYFPLKQFHSENGVTWTFYILGESSDIF